MPERGPYAKGRERREAILAATLEVFAQSGYRGTSLRAIAKELGIGASLVQHYFSTREELLTEVIRAWDAENRRRSDGLPMLDAFLSNIEHNMSIPGLVHLYTAYAVEATDPDHAARPFFDQRYRDMTVRFVKDLTQRQSAGTAPADLDVAEAAQLIIATCEGLQIQWLHSAEFDIYQKFWQFLATLGIEPYRSHPPHPAVEDAVSVA